MNGTTRQTGRRRINKNLLIRKIIETTDAAVIGMSLDGTIQFWNNGAMNSFGYDSSEVFNLPIQNLIALNDLDYFNGFLDKAKRGEKVYRFECYGKTKDRRKIYLSVTLSHFGDGENIITGISMIARDISDRKNAEDDLKTSREQLRNFTKHMEFIKEKEMKQIAMQVHDELGQSLTALTLDLSWLSKKLHAADAEVINKFNSMFELIDKTAELVSNITAELRPSVLDHFGLVPGIEWQAEEHKKRTRIAYIITKKPNEIKLDEHRTIVVFRIFQEIYTNIIRHAHATLVKINLIMTDTEFTMEVIDNGIGISPEKLTHPNSYGIMGIAERVNGIKGKFVINGQQNQGTTVRITIPLNIPEDNYD